MGSEDGLFLLEIADDGAHRLGDKKVVQIEVVQEEDTVIYLGGTYVYNCSDFSVSCITRMVKVCACLHS